MTFFVTIPNKKTHKKSPLKRAFFNVNLNGKSKIYGSGFGVVPQYT